MSDALSGFLDASIGSSALAQLTDEQRRRLTAVLERYLAALEQGTPLSQSELLSEHSDLAAVLESYFRSLELLHEMAGGMGPARRTTDATEGSDDASPGDVKQRVGDFELLREIGRGGMGVVYEARQLSLGRRVAVKLLPFASVLDARQIARFKYEAQAAAQLQHPNIVSVFAVGVDAGVHYYAMPLIAGKPLDQVVAEERTRAKFRGSSAFGNRSARVAAAICIGVQAAEALQAAHENGVVHRDIKPSNLLLEPSGKVWVTDFGLARCQRETSLTRTGDLIGTLRYMSPEQAAGRSEFVDHRTDIYSLGVTLYELLCLRPAFEDQSGPGLLRQMEAHDPPRPRKLRAEISADLETVVLKAMARQREDRYASAREFAADLQRVQDGKPIHARPPRLLERLGRRARRHQLAVVITAGVTTAACLGLLVSTILIAREKARAETHAASAERRFREAREVVDRFGVRLSQELAGVAGAEQTRRELLTQAEEYYRSFIAEAGADPRLRADLANAYGRIALLVDDAGGAEEAAAAHAQAVRMFAELAAADPNDLKSQKQIALARNNWASALGRSGKWDDARVQFAAALKLQSDLSARYPNNADLLGDLALTHSNTGLMLQELGRDDEARAAFRAAADILRRLHDAQPEHAEYARRSAAVLNNLAGTYLKTKPREAIALHQQALDLQTAIAARHADDASLRREIALTHQNLAAAYARTRDVDRAVANYDHAVGLLEDLVRRLPSQTLFVRDLAVTSNNVGLVRLRMGKTAEAEEAFRRSVQLHARLLALQPTDAALLNGSAGAHANLSVALERLGRREDAVAAIETAIREQRHVVAQTQDRDRPRAQLEKHQTVYQRLLRDLDRDEDHALTGPPPAPLQSAESHEPS